MVKKYTVLLTGLGMGEYPFDELFDIVAPVFKPDEIDGWASMDEVESVALVIWGGEDISPSIYGEKGNDHTNAPSTPSRRDQLEIALCERAFKNDIPIIGICRGAQLLCALSGGKLIQHVDGHAGGVHEIVTHDGRNLKCPTLHHQMMWPWGIKGPDSTPGFDMLAWTPKPLSKKYLGPPCEKKWVENGVPNRDEWPEELVLPGMEPEVIWIPHSKSLCIQSHPEFIDNSSHPFVQYSLELTKKYVLGSPA